ncbi:hypothetical protein [Brachybacterium phenoliresistens]|uniref:Uncharacterized protein n=1 Tax=Brachybacterium phenoliresistens TaxID=396014 RepID=Z9JTB4_9MICO|nr:hypothetical protein [Brachybacterium phenoliresistens]EWS81011.1 hypothetical protein BF93_01135 [Brachybacterium phenoliresistens]
MQEQRFAYAVSARTAVGGLLLGLVFLGASGWGLVHGWGISLYLAHFGADVARWFYLGGMVLGLVLLLGFLRLVLAGRREVVVSAQRITAPASESSRRLVEIDPAAIRRITMRSSQGVHSAIITHRGRTVRLRSPHFASHGHFLACLDAIEDARSLAAGESPGR